MQKKPIIVLTLGLVLVFSAIPLSINAESELIPDWIKNTAGFWANDQISDVEFMNAIEYLITQGTIQVPNFSGVPDVDTITIGFIPTEKAAAFSRNVIKQVNPKLPGKLGLSYWRILRLWF